MNWKVICSGITALVGLAIACPFDAIDAPKWTPIGIDAYLTRSFGDHSPDGKYPGLLYSTSGKTHLPTQAAEDGQILYLRAEAGKGKTLVLKGISGHLWTYGRLSAFSPALEQIFQKAMQGKAMPFSLSFPPDKAPRVKEYDTIAYAGLASDPQPHFYLELKTPGGLYYRNPCEVGVACYDSITPQFLGAAVWDARNPTRWSHSSAEALHNGCLQVSPDIQDPRVAFYIRDIATSNQKHPFAIHAINLRQGTELLYHYEISQIPTAKRTLSTSDYLASEIDSAGVWHRIQGKDAQLAKYLYQASRQDQPLPITIEASDTRAMIKLLQLYPRPQCSPAAKPERSLGKEYLYTHLGRPWIQLASCAQGARVSLLDSHKQILERHLCDSLPHAPIEIGALLYRWPSARSLSLRTPQGNSHSIAIHPLTSQPLNWSQDGVRLQIFPTAEQVPTALAWELSSQPNGLWRWKLHPMGLAMTKAMRYCLPDSLQDPCGELPQPQVLFRKSKK